MSSLPKYASLVNGIVDSITFYPDRDKEGNLLPPWIPVADDVYAGYVAGPDDSWIPPDPPTPPPEGIPDFISRREFFQQLAVDKLITEEEAYAALGGVIPAAMLALITQLPAEEQFNAKMLVAGATDFYRNHQLTHVIQHMFNWTDERADQFWLDASKL